MSSRPSKVHRRALYSLSAGDAQERGNKKHPQDEPQDVNYWKNEVFKLREQLRRSGREPLDTPPAPSSKSVSSPTKQSTTPAVGTPQVPKLKSKDQTTIPSGSQLQRGKRKTTSSSSSIRIYTDDEGSTKPSSLSKKSKVERVSGSSSSSSSSSSSGSISRISSSSSSSSSSSGSSSSGGSQEEEDLQCHETFPSELEMSSQSVAGLTGKELDTLKAKDWAMSAENLRLKHSYANLMEFYKAANVESEGLGAEVEQFKAKSQKADEEHSALVEYRLLYQVQQVTIRDLEAQLAKFRGETKEEAEETPRPHDELAVGELDVIRLKLSESLMETRNARSEIVRLQNQIKDLRNQFVSDVTKINKNTSAQMQSAREDYETSRTDMETYVQNLRSQLEAAKEGPSSS